MARRYIGGVAASGIKREIMTSIKWQYQASSMATMA